MAVTKAALAHLLADDFLKEYGYRRVRRTWRERLTSEFWTSHKLVPRWPTDD